MAVRIGYFGWVAVTAGALATVALVAAGSTPWLWLVVAVDSGSAAAIAPPALPMKRPVASTQTPAARRISVEMVVSPRQQVVLSVGNVAICRTVFVPDYLDSAVNLPQ